ncbi:MAG: multicopper oxidase domain-containing protein [Gammaproteobacteria bacterium]
MNTRLSRLLIALIQLAVAAVVCVLLVPGQWYSDATRIRLAQWFGTPGYRQIQPDQAAAGEESDPLAAAELCPQDPGNWRQAQRIEGVTIGESLACLADNPYAVAAFVRGTNNVSRETLMAAGLTPDAVEKGADLDGDGDPDEIHIRLEVVELNGASPDSNLPVTSFEIAPGVTPGLWVFAPKTFGMATVNFESNQARDILRPPSPTIRIEQGDRVFITLENTHYLPHTMHFHGVDHPFLDANGEGNDGVPVTSELPLQPGQARTYEMQPRQPGTMFYHCHVQVQVHVMMGLQGMFVVEENRPDNWLQTLNVGAGHVRAPSRSSTESFAAEYDLHFTDLDTGLNNLIQQSNDPRETERLVNREYNITTADSDYYLLNGKSFPLTFQESLIVTEPDQRVKLRVLNGGSVGLALHTHGHKPTATHYDGVALDPLARVTRDVFWLASAQRTDLELNTANDGLHAYGSGVWLLHDHQERGVTNNGLGPGGNLGAIVYREFLGEDGWPRTSGENLAGYFQPAYYQRQPLIAQESTSLSSGLFLRLLVLGIAIGAAGASLLSIFRVMGGGIK